MATFYQSWEDVPLGETVYLEWPDSALMDTNDVSLEPFRVVDKTPISATLKNAGRGLVVITNLRAIRRSS